MDDPELLTSRLLGSTAAQIASGLRGAIEDGVLAPGGVLPPARLLASQLQVNRNTVSAAYKTLGAAGLVRTRGRAGTVVVDQGQELPEAEGFAAATVLRDVCHGNPARSLLPEIGPVLSSLSAEPVLYGESPIDPGLASRATTDFDAELQRPFRLTITGGAVEALEQLLALVLQRGDAVALEDPCFLSSISTVRRGGYRALPVPLDGEGMLPEGLRSALLAGARAVVCTPRAQNPTGVSTTARRAAALREVLRDFPQVLVIEDDHFWALSTSPHHSVIDLDRARWVLIRSVSKFLGPDLRVAMVASDPGTARGLAAASGSGATWVSHLLQRLVHALLEAPDAHARVRAAAAHYRSRNAAFVRLLAARNVIATADDGLNVWVQTEGESRRAVERLMRRGWLARSGDDFGLDGRSAQTAGRIRVTVHELDDGDAAALADAIAAATRHTPLGDAMEEDHA